MKLKKRRFIQCLYVLALVLPMILQTITPDKIQSIAVAANGEEYIKWIDFTVTEAALSDAVEADVVSYGKENHVNFITLLSLLSSKYGGDFSNYKKSDLTAFCDRLESGEKAEELTSNQKIYRYYNEAYRAVLGGFVGEFAVPSDYETTGLYYEKKYGLKVFSPIASGYGYSHFDDFGAARSYGYRRPHLGHDMMGSIGTPIIAVESGYVEACGWNMYGGWRIGIRSFDGKRYYYYAHLRKGHPYNDMYEGKLVQAGEVIGYLGMTGYSRREDTNNINTPHLHFGLQIIFDSSQKDGWNQIWLDMYELTKFLQKNTAVAVYDKESKEYISKSAIIDLSMPD